MKLGVLAALQTEIKPTLQALAASSQGPCYMLRDAYHPTFKDLVDKTEWHKYGPSSGEPRCQTCMVHAGFEPTVASGRGIKLGKQLYNAVKMMS